MSGSGRPQEHAGRRPRVVTYNLASVDGRLTIAPDVQLLTGDPRWAAIAGESDPYAWVRDVHDPEVLLEGSGSFVAEGAAPIPYPPGSGGPAEIDGHHLPPEVVDVPGRRWLAVVDSRGRVQLRFTEWPDPAWGGWHALVLTSRAAAPEHLAWLRAAGIPYLVAGDGPVDLPLAMQRLADLLGVRTVVSTGGGRLNGALLRAGLVDEVDVELLPALIGGRGTPALFDAPPLDEAGWPTALDLLAVEVVDHDHVRLRYRVDDHGSSHPG
jgi:2,5-diamino-6-(ribosylamino)-4(3H)-pyrimidinone 5'-phosphate reductase